METTSKPVLNGMIAAMALTLFSAAASASTVTYSGVNDANPVGGFDSATTVPDGSDGNILNIGLDNFSVFSANNTPANTFDTISFVVEAPTGWVITGIEYTEHLTAERTYTNGGAVTISTGSWVVDNKTTYFDQVIGTSDLGGSTFEFDMGLSKSWNVSDAITDLEISINNQITAVAFGDGEASLTKYPATFTVTLSQVPLPPAVWLLGSAILGLGTIRRRIAA